MIHTTNGLVVNSWGTVRLVYERKGTLCFMLNHRVSKGGEIISINLQEIYLELYFVNLISSFIESIVGTNKRLLSNFILSIENIFL